MHSSCTNLRTFSRTSFASCGISKSIIASPPDAFPLGPTGSSRRGDERLGALEQPERRRVQHVADGARRLPGAGARVRALEYDAQLEACEHGVPADGRHIARRPLSVA